MRETTKILYTILFAIVLPIVFLARFTRYRDSFELDETIRYQKMVSRNETNEYQLALQFKRVTRAAKIVSKRMKNLAKFPRSQKIRRIL